MESHTPLQLCVCARVRVGRYLSPPLLSHLPQPHLAASPLPSNL